MSGISGYSLQNRVQSIKNAIAAESRRFREIQLHSATYGISIPIIFGKTRVPSNVIDFMDFTGIPQTTSSGGKGGDGPTNTTYTYTVAVELALGETVSSVTKVWAGKENPTLASLGLTLYNNAVYGYWTTYHSSHALKYKNVSRVAGVISLDSSATMPDFTFECNGLNQYNTGAGVHDTLATTMAKEILSNVNFGAGFPSANVGAMTGAAGHQSWCLANSLFFSLCLNQQREAREWLEDIAAATVSAWVWSQAVLEMLPFGDTAVTGTYGTYTPDLTPTYDLTDDDFKIAGGGSDGDDNFQITRIPATDIYNVTIIEYLDRADDYSVDTKTSEDFGSIRRFTKRPADPLQIHMIHDATTAAKVAQLINKRRVNITAEYHITLGWEHCLLKPMDLVTITIPELDMDETPVRVLSIEEDENGYLEVTAEEFPGTVSDVADYEFETATRTKVDFNVDPGNANAPVIFEPPAELCQNYGYELWIGVSGADPNWGGCYVWFSEDDLTYKNIGMVTGPARQGTLTAILASGSDPDTTNICAVDLTDSRGQLGSGTQQDADNKNTLCLVQNSGGGAGVELISYQTATLTSAYHYNLEDYLRRGVYGTVIASHGVGSEFLRLDTAVFKYPFGPSDVGKTIYIKLQSFNVYQGGLQDISGLSAYTFVLVGRTPAAPSITLVATSYGIRVETS